MRYSLSNMAFNRHPVKGRPPGVILGFALVMAVALSAQGQSATDALFEKFFTAENPADAVTVADLLVAGGVDFDAAYATLKKGRFYGDEKRGEFSLRWKLPTFVRTLMGVLIH